jgi:hypothetical protein
MANERLRPFRDYDEHDVLNLFAFGDSAVALGVTDVVYAGSVVKIKTGWSNDDETQDMIGNVGAGYDNTVSQRWGVTADVEYCNGGSETPLGITLYDVREYEARSFLQPERLWRMELLLRQALPFTLAVMVRLHLHKNPMLQLVKLWVHLILMDLFWSNWNCKTRRI